jgi:hypothetical protein
MAGIEMKGFEDLKRNVEQFSKIVQEEAIKAAEDAAAQVVKAAVEAAAPRDTGQLASSVDRSNKLPFLKSISYRIAPSFR